MHQRKTDKGKKTVTETRTSVLEMGLETCLLYLRQGLPLCTRYLWIYLTNFVEFVILQSRVAQMILALRGVCKWYRRTWRMAANCLFILVVWLAQSDFSLRSFHCDRNIKQAMEKNDHWEQLMNVSVAEQGENFICGIEEQFVQWSGSSGGNQFHLRMLSDDFLVIKEKALLRRGKMNYFHFSQTL